MIKALRSASSGMVVQSLKQDIIANNIANAQTPGFKRSKLVAESFAQTLQNTTASLIRTNYPNSPVGTVIAQANAALDTSQGSIRNTENKLDFAISGPGAFEIATPNGTQLTRAGNFQINSLGELCTTDGYRVQGQAGSIRIADGNWNVTENGTIVLNGQPIDQIKIVGAQNNTTVLQGHLEESNLNIVREMVEMISNLRSYEANQKVISFTDHTLDKLINEVGRV